MSKKYDSKINQRPEGKSRTRRLLRFLPAFALFAIAAFINLAPSIQQHTKAQVLGYATSLNSSDLLTYTNQQRAAGSVAALSLNSKLTNAAQAKANDMVARDYWSHTTPEGEQPWVFMTNAGYNYKTAGENLAYGFATSSETITGWMNSPPHRQNLMNSAFLDVGFGMANSANFVGNGAQTVIVAMYGAQQGSSPAPPPPASTTKPQSTPQVQSQAAAPTPVTKEPINAPAPAAETEPVSEPAVEEPTKAQNVFEDPVVAAPTQIRRVQIITAGSAQWSSGLLVAGMSAVALLWLIKRGKQIRHLITAGEGFLLNHLHIDLTVVGILVLGWSLFQVSGIVR